MTYTKEQPLLSVQNLNVTYGDRVIIKDINFTEHDIVRPGGVQGQIVAVVGRSGSGKSTLFKALTGLIKPTEGRVIIPDLARGGNAAKEVYEGDMGFVDQKYTLFRHKTASQILTFSLRKTKLTPAEKTEKVHHYLDAWGLSSCKNLYRHEMSGGQRQRVAIIAQLLCSGMFMVMDEPFSGLDAINVDDVKKYFNMILSEHELNTIIFSTHDLPLACEIAQSIYVIGFPPGKKYGSIVKHYDLRELGLSWQPLGQGHLDLAKQLKNDQYTYS